MNCRFEFGIKTVNGYDHTVLLAGAYVNDHVAGSVESELILK